MIQTPPRLSTRRTGLIVIVAAAIVGGLIALGSMGATADSDFAATTTTLPKAPDFTVGLFDGTTFNLADHLANDGRPVILNLWASWCPPCKAEMPDLDQFQAEQPQILVLGIAVADQEASARAVAYELGVSYALGFDAAETVAAAYPPIGMPATWFIGQDGTIRNQVVGQVSLERIRELSAGAFGF